MRALLLLLAGCIDVHDFHGGAIDAAGPITDGPIALPDVPAQCDEVSPGSDLAWTVGSLTTSTTSGVAIGGAGWALHFNPNAMHFPFSYKVATKELLATAAICQDASLSGVSVTPGGRSDAGDVGTSSIVEVVGGPDVASYQIVWMAQLGCVSATVTSTWTMFPDGRITRRDQIANPVTGTNGCTCTQSSPNGISVQAETLFASDAIDLVTQSNGSSIPQSSTADAAIPAAVCLTGGVAANLVSLAGPGSAGKLYSSSFNTDIGLAYHFFDGTPLAAAEGTSSFVPVPVDKPCSEAVAALAGFTQGVAVALDNQLLVGVRARDGVFGELTTGIDVHDAARFTVPSGVPAPPGFAIGLHFVDGARTTYGVTRNGTPLGVNDARVQYVDNHHAVLWLRDSFGGANAACDRIDVTAMP